MRTFSTERRRVATFMIVLAIATLMLPSLAYAQSFTVDSVTINSVVEPDGNLKVSEQRTLSFDGDFTRVFWTFPTEGTGGYEILGVRQTEPVQRELTRSEDPSTLESRPEGVFLVQESGGQVEVHAFHRTSNSSATFVVDYRVMDAVKRYTDVGELYWQAIGPRWDVPTGRVAVAIEPPAELTKEQVRAWAHGPLNGVVAIAENGVVTLDVDNLPANTFVEARVLYPSAALPDAPIIAGTRAPEVLAEEGKLAEEANRERTSARIFLGVWIGIPWIGALLALFFGVRAFIKHGREHKTEFQGQYFREDPRPDLHPAVIGALWRFGKVEDVDIAATLMDLADKGVIKMVPFTAEKDGIAGIFGGTEQSFVLQRVREKEAQASVLDRQLLSLLFDTVGGGQDTVGLNELPRYAKANPESFSESVKAWKDSASAQAEVLGFFEPEGRAWQIGTFIVAVFLVVVAIFGTVLTGSGWPLLVPVPVAITLAVLGIFMNRRSREGNELYRTYVAVRDFLKDFSRLEEAPPASVILWNRFLVLAVVFGIADEVIEQLRIRLPDVVKDPGFQTSYWWVYAGAYGHSPVSTISQSFVSASQVATSQMSSASGGGGGFSGGGGGGFGGGGGGAD
ncbi:MAG TPA: DUF2207 domain-containing protein [Coriobacteriia bacterium]|nr:DUF2207 domain-containing protein [Coriobacteriia bacterium]